MKRQREVGAADLPFVALDEVLQHRARIGAAVLLARHALSQHLASLERLIQQARGKPE